jgi:diguanylate cyclase (GGDEF)-like protein
MVTYLDHRGILTPYRAVAAAIVGALAVVPLVMVVSPMGPRGTPAKVASVAVSALIVGTAATWMVRRARRPSRVQSQLFSIISSGCVATMCLIQSQPLIGLMGCTAFAVLTTYISFFHTAAYMLTNLVVGTSTAAVLAGRLVSSTGDVALAISALIVLTALNLAVPLAVQSLLRALGMDLALADRDPLTGLLNRRAFHRESLALLARHRSDAVGKYLVVALVDLDKFKQLNDCHGHEAGDQALIAVAAGIRRSCRHRSVIARAGGEEFVIADVSRDPDMSAMAGRIRRAIAELPASVTASVGTASIALDEVQPGTEQRHLTKLTQNADDAMYRAKRAGGNQVAHHHPSPNEAHGAGPGGMTTPQRAAP